MYILKAPRGLLFGNSGDLTIIYFQAVISNNNTKVANLLNEELIFVNVKRKISIT